MRKLLLLITLLLSSCSGNIPSSENWVLNFKIKINDACILENGSLYCVAYDKDAYGKILETHEYTYQIGYYMIVLAVTGTIAGVVIGIIASILIKKISVNKLFNF